MRILIITVFFPPKNSIASLRPYSWAKHWARLGHEVTVLTTKKLPNASDLHLPYEGFDVVEVAVPGMAFLARFLGPPNRPVTTQVATGKPTALAPKVKHKLVYWFRSIQQKYGVMYTCRLPDIHDLWVLPAMRNLPAGNWDIVISSAGPYSVNFIGWLLKKRKTTSCWIADWRDLWSSHHHFPGLPIIKGFERYLDKKLNQTADLITTVSHPLAREIEKFGTPAHVIFNGFDPDDHINLCEEKFFPDDGKIRIVYTGTIYPGRQDPTPLFQAISILEKKQKISPEKIEISFASKLLDIAELAEREGVLPYIKSLGFLPREDALRMQKEASALLFLEYQGQAEGILTGKIFEYLHAGPPILALGISQDSAASELIRQSGKGHVMGNDVSAICKWLEYFLETNIPPPTSPTVTDITQFSREQQALKLLQLASAKVH